jgi:citronellol/citronellal dehydrogenase
LKGKTIIVTGASRGIGAAIAERCAKDGANLVLTSKTVDPHPKLAGTLGETAEMVEAAGGQALVVQADVRYEEAVQSVVDAAVEKFGGVDGLVNNAGAISLTPCELTSMKRYDLMQSINTRAPFMCAKLCLPHLKESAEKGNHPHVLNLSPPVSLEPHWLANHTAYTSSRTGSRTTRRTRCRSTA